MSETTTATNDPNGDRIRKVLVDEKIKLWKPPYYGVPGAPTAVQELAAALAARREWQQDVAATVTAVRAFQERALAKLRSQGRLLPERLEIKIPAGIPAAADDEAPCGVLAAERAEISSDRKVLALRRVHPDATVAQLHQQLLQLLQVDSVKLICKGQQLMGCCDGDGDAASSTARLADALLDQRRSNKNNTAATTTTTTAVRLLCLIVPISKAWQQQEQDTDSTTNNRTSAGNNNNSSNPDEALVESICRAASQLQRESNFDVTDAQGNLVSMQSQEKVAFLKALGLHALGRKRMAANNHSSNNCESGLTFLLRADREWNRLDAAWRSRVDNYGRLQLDICWIFLKLQSLEHLDDVTERLARAEAALRKQVHANFLTLALVRAEQHRPVPAVSLLFVRLFLLQGVAWHYHRGNSSSSNGSKARERLEWAAALCASLRRAAPPEAVARLCEVLPRGTATAAQAVAALRRAEGDLNRAAELAASDREAAARSARNRREQTRLGRCENGRDFCDLGVLAQLQTALDLQDDGDGNHLLVASGLLRLSNNQLDRAIDMYQELARNHTEILRRVAALDRRQGVPPAVSRKRGRADSAGAEPDPVAVAQLVSTGAAESAAQARNALRRNRNSVELALLWLTTTTTNRSDPNDAAIRRADRRHRSPTLVAHAHGNAGAAAVSPETVTANAAHDNTDSDGNGDAAEDNLDLDDDGGVEEEEEEETLSEEEEAVDLLERVLGEVLQDQNQTTDENLGESLDEEWSYIEQFRAEIN